MDTIGTEVGLKMRSAIKAKLMELGCYVDDELPDYVMVMVANKRSRMQMEEDLQLFLRSHTITFVDWLQHVLNKLKEVTITNPGMYACTSFRELKRKATLEIAECIIKKEKKDKKTKQEKKSKPVVETVTTVNRDCASITDEIPVDANKLVEKRNHNTRPLLNSDNNKAESSKDTKSSCSSSDVLDKNEFDIPTLAEVGKLNDAELDEIEEKIKEARDKLDLLKSDSEDEDFINIRADAEELLANELNDASNPPTFSEEQPPKPASKAVKLKRSDDEISPEPSTSNVTTGSKPSHAEKPIEPSESEKKSTQQPETKKTKISLSETLREEKEMLGKIRGNVHIEVSKPATKKPAKRESVYSRLGLPSCIIALNKNPERKVDSPVINDKQQSKSLPSVVQVRPRRIVTGPCQPSKNLLLRAVAEAQKSVVQAATRTNKNKEALYSKKYRETHNILLDKKVSTKNKTGTDSVQKVQNIKIQLKNDNSKTVATVLDEDSSDYVLPDLAVSGSEANIDDNDYIPNTIDLNYDDLDKYIQDTELDESKSTDENVETEVETTNHQFIVTLDGLKSDLIKDKDENSSSSSEPAPKVPKKCPSPIIFDKGSDVKAPKSVCKVPEKLPKVHVPVAVKTKERCKFWPNCWLGESCEFIHPKSNCNAFPMCKFGDQCLYIHPKCKFDSSCTRKECPYSHKNGKVHLKLVPRALSYRSSTSLEICKYYPKCSNIHCQYYHPKLCRFGKYCMNKAECNFSHGKTPTKEKLTWSRRSPSCRPPEHHESSGYL